MEFIEYTITWCKGEIFEAKMVLLAGLIFLICSFLFYKYGTTIYSKTIVWPLLIASMIFIISGAFMQYSNEKRINTSKIEYKIDKKRFILEEKNRVESFMPWYTNTRITMSILIFAALFFYFFGGAILKSLALVFILIALAGFTIDHFSEERAKAYYKNILIYEKKI